MEWNSQLTRRLVELKSDPEEYTEVEIADKLSKENNFSISRNQVHGKLVGINLDTFESESPRPIYMPYYDKYQKTIENLKPAPKKQFEIFGRTIIDERDEIKILKLGDIHIPFEVDKYIQTAVNRNMTADYVIIDEVMDCYSISRFDKRDNIPFEVEVDRTVRFYEYISNTFPDSKIILLNTNHGGRVQKKISEIPASLFFLTETDINKTLAKPFPNIVSHPEWFIEINDCIGCHCEKVSSAYMTRLGSVTSAYNFFLQWEQVLGIVKPRVIMQGHTHQVGASYEMGGECKIMETGCLCEYLDYSVIKAYGRPSTPGYGTVVQRKGKSDMNLSREWTIPGGLYKGRLLWEE